MANLRAFQIMVPMRRLYFLGQRIPPQRAPCTLKVWDKDLREVGWNSIESLGTSLSGRTVDF